MDRKVSFGGVRRVRNSCHPHPTELHRSAAGQAVHPCQPVQGVLGETRPEQGAEHGTYRIPRNHHAVRCARPRFL